MVDIPNQDEEHLKRCVYYLLALIYLDLAGVRRLTEQEFSLAEDLTEWAYRNRDVTTVRPRA